MASSRWLGLLCLFICCASAADAAEPRKLLQQCSAATPNPCYNSIGTKFKCCPGGCPSNPTTDALCAGDSGVDTSSQAADTGFLNGIEHVLIISVDGLHSVDVEYLLAQNPNSPGFGYLASHGTRYRNAYTTFPSDSYPGTLAIISGGGAYTNGVFYDHSYNRDLSPPLNMGGDTSCSKKGTQVIFDETIDIDLTKLNGGGGINTDALPRDGSKGCTPVYPNQYLRVNNIFEVASQSNLYTGFTDKSTGGYVIAKGPSGAGVTDYASLEIKTTDPAYADTTGTQDGLIGANGVPAYDAAKVQIVKNWIDGYNHDRSQNNGKAPAIMYMNYQVVSVNQKIAGQGYLNDNAPPNGPVPSTYVKQAIDYVDRTIGEFVNELKNNDILGKTVVIVTAKHGQSPIDGSKLFKISPGKVTSAIATLLNDPSEPAQFTADDGGLIWLKNPSNGAKVRDYLNANKAQFGITQCYLYSELGFAFTSFVPDILCDTQYGLIYTGGSKIAEHGGNSDDDRHVPLLLSNPYLSAKVYDNHVDTKQIAPTTLTVLGLDYTKLQAVQIEGTQLLPDTGLY